MKPMVRRARPEDATQAAECLIELCYAIDDAAVVDALQRLDASPTDAVLVAVDDATHRLVGIVGVHLIPLLHISGHVARITALAVRAEARRQGVGRSLVAATERFAEQAGCRRVEVTSGDHRPDAHAFYATLGYRVDERRFIKQLAPSPP